MSCVCVFTPVVVEMAWPVLATALTASLASLGYHVSQEAETRQKEAQAQAKVELELKQTHKFEEGLGEDEELSVEKDGLTLTFKKSADGRLRVCAAGALDEERLRAAGAEAMNKFLQVYVHQKVTAELAKRGFKVEEETLDDGTIRLKARNWG